MGLELTTDQLQVRHPQPSSAPSCLYTVVLTIINEVFCLNPSYNCSIYSNNDALDTTFHISHPSNNDALYTTFHISHPSKMHLQYFPIILYI